MFYFILNYPERYTVTKRNCMEWTSVYYHKFKTLVTYEIVYISDAYGNCSLWYAPDDEGLTTETCRGGMD
jgi:hypothetical protein